jgi:hypothetical protein
MIPQYTKSLAVAVVLTALDAGANAATLVNVNTYSYLNAPSLSYPDSGNELTDGVTDVISWPNVNFVSDPYGEVAKLVSWLDITPVVQFDFGTIATISSVTVWAADSDGAAGVALPSLITISTPDLSFSQSFVINNPAGYGSTVPLELSGFSVTTDKLIVSATPTAQWTMFSEVQFFTPVPEPATATLVAGLAGLSLLRRRRA